MRRILGSRTRGTAASALITLCLAKPAAAEIIGYTDPLTLPSLLQNSRLFDSAGSVNLSGNPIVFTDTSVFGGPAAAEISGMTFTGLIDAPGTAPGVSVQAGSFRRDQLHVSTLAGAPIDIAFDFTIDYELALSGGYGRFYMALDNAWVNSLDPSIPYALYSESLITLSEGAGSFTKTMRFNDIDSTRMIGSGLYVPFSLGIRGIASDARLDWSHTIGLTSVRGFDQFGNQLAPDQFTIEFTSGLAAPGATVPEPGTCVLLTTGLLVHSWRRRRHRGTRTCDVKKGSHDAR